MKTLLALLSLSALAVLARPAPVADWNALRIKAEEQYAQGSFALARATYLEADPSKLDSTDRRWLTFRLADTLWRASSGSASSDTTEVDTARKELEALQRPIERLEQRDRVWALVEESLADWSWLRRNVRDWGGSLPHYQNALEWWGGARDIDTARTQYLKIVFRMGWPDGAKGGHGGLYGYAPLDIVQNAVRIARAPAEIAQANMLLARTVQQHGGDWDAQARMFESLRKVVALGKDVRFYDDALHQLATSLENNGEPKVNEDGEWRSTPDYVEALTHYRRLVLEFGKGDSAYFDEATHAIQRITKNEVGVAVSTAFLPGSEVGFALSWRNAPRVELALYPVDLTRAPTLTDGGKSAHAWLETIDLGSLQAVKSWSHETEDDGRHVPKSVQQRIEPKLAPGAYVLAARAGEARAREIVLVSDMALAA